MTTQVAAPPTQAALSQAQEWLAQQGITDPAKIAEVAMQALEHANSVRAENEQLKQGRTMMQQAAAMQAPQQPTIDPRQYLQFFQKDQAGNLVPKPGAEYALTPNVINAVNQYQQQRMAHAAGLAEDPVNYLWQQEAMQQRVNELVEQRVQEAFQKQQHASGIERWIEANQQRLDESTQQRLIQVCADLTNRGVPSHQVGQLAIQTMENEWQMKDQMRSALDGIFGPDWVNRTQQMLAAQQQQQPQMQMPPQYQQPAYQQPQMPYAPQSPAYQPQFVTPGNQQYVPQGSQSFMQTVPGYQNSGYQPGNAPPSFANPGDMYSQNRSGVAASSAANIAQQASGVQVDLDMISRQNLQAAGLLDDE